MKKLTWNDIYLAAEGTACMSPVLKAKDEARHQVRQLILKKEVVDLEDQEIPEDEVEEYCNKYDITFDNSGNISSILGNIELNKVDNDEYYCGITVDSTFKVVDGSRELGIIYLSQYYTGYYIEYIELNEPYRGKKLFRLVLTRILEILSLDRISFRANNDYIEMYKHLGAEEINFDSDTEMTEFLLKLDAL